MKRWKQAGHSAVNMLAAGLITLAMAAGALPQHSEAATQSAAPAAKVSFTFDDGLTSAVANAAPTLQKHGLVGTDYVITGCVGMSKAPNTCHANTDASYMTWTQIKKLQSTYGWEIGSHSVTHPYLATKDASDGQPRVLTPAQVTAELVDSKAALAKQGIDATDFSTPYGDYNNYTLAEIAKYYASHRGFADEGNNTWPNNDYLLYDMRVQAGVSVAQVKSRIDQAIANNQWLVLTFHDIKYKPSQNPDDYQYATKDLDAIAAYVQSKQNQIQAITVNQGLVKSDQNLLPNSSFDNGISQGWTTDNPTAVTKDTGTNGSYPSPTNSIKFVANDKAARLYTPHVSVNPATTYMLKSFLNVQKHTSGDVEYYIDEYDANGNWISGQYKKAEPSAFVEEMNLTYKPSSPSVSTADLQLTVTANSGITAYVDNFQWFATSTDSTDNVLFSEDFDKGISNGWTTDAPAAITADANNNGSPTSAASQQNSVKLQSTASTGHLFSGKFSVVNGASYDISNYLDVRSITNGEVAFYIDEYDAAGNWISGQYKLGVHTPGAQTVGFHYVPTSSNVTTVSLQVIVTANPGITAYLDDIRWSTAN